MKLMLMTVGSLSRSQNQHPFCVYNKVLTLQQNIDILIDHPYLVLLCDTCERNISFAVSILAQEKENGEYWDMCTTCFIKHMTKFVHYFVRPSTNFTITEEKWSINSHLMLMQALIVLGKQSWRQVKHYLDYHGVHFLSEEIKKYYQKYIKNQKAQFRQKLFMQVFRPNKYHIQQKRMVQNSNEDIISTKNRVLFQYYNPKRQQYAIRDDAEAQKMISNIEFRPDDTEEEAQLKMNLIEAYQQRIKLRKRRQEFVTEHGLLSREKQLKNLSEGKIKNEIRKSMNLLLRFQTSQENDKLIGCLTLQKELKQLIALLQKCQRKKKNMTFNAVFEVIEEKRRKRDWPSLNNYQGFKVLYSKEQDNDDESGQKRMDFLKKKVKENLGVEFDTCKVTRVSGYGQL